MESAEKDVATRWSSEIEYLISALGHEKGRQRELARRALITISQAALPALIHAVQKGSYRVRWEAVQALGAIGDLAAVPALIDALEDELFSVRWLAAKALASLGPDALPILLHAIIENEHEHNVWFWDGAHHVLGAYADGALGPLVAPIMKALESALPSTVYTAAYDALRVLGAL